MITREIIKMKVKDGKLYLTAKTEKCQYSQVYDLVRYNQPNYVESFEQAQNRFMSFYNQFE